MPEHKTSQREAMILGLLVNGEKYGREIRDEYQRAAQQKMPLGSLYTTLDRMEQKGFIKSRLGDSNPVRGGNRRRFFRITASGQRALDQFQLALNNIQFLRGVNNG